MGEPYVPVCRPISYTYYAPALAETGGSKAQASLVTLEQSLEPNFRPPKPFDGLIKGDISLRDHPALHLNWLHDFEGYKASSMLTVCMDRCRYCSASTEDDPGAAKRRGA